MNTQINGTESRDPYNHGKLIFGQAQTIQWRNDSLFHQWCWDWTCKGTKKNESQPKFPIVYKNELQIDHRSKI